MAEFNYGDLVIAKSMVITSWEDLRLLYVGDDEFLRLMPEGKYYVTMQSSGDPLELVDNWYSIHQNHFIVEVMDRGLRLRPDLVVFNYHELFSGDLDEAALELIVNQVGFALSSGHAVAIVYDETLEPAAPSRLAELFPNFNRVAAH